METSTEKNTLVELQHVNVKLLLCPADDFDLAPLIPIFHRWIQERTQEELLIDVADYRHVPSGPGVVLIGHEADYSLDERDGRLGFRYNRKAVIRGSNHDRLKQATRSVLEALHLLEQNPELATKLGFSGQEIEIHINDRLLAPNTQETQRATEADFRGLFDKLFVPGEYSLVYPQDRRRLFGVYARARRTSTTVELLKRLGSQTDVAAPESTKGIAGFCADRF